MKLIKSLTCGMAIVPMVSCFSKGVPNEIPNHDNPSDEKEEQMPEHPNILLIVTDQQSFNTISAHSDLYRESYSQTPNIDRLVKSGTSFTQAYCANPVSVPSRFALFSGMYGGKYAVRENQTALADGQEIRQMLQEHGMGYVFERGGYDTYYGGKVHLPFSGENGASKFSAPTSYGFKTYYTKDEREILGKETAKLLDAKAEEIRKGDSKPFLMIASFLNPHDICYEGGMALKDLPNDGNASEKDMLKMECIRHMRERAEAIDSVEFYKSYAPALPYNFGQSADFPELKRSKQQNLPEYYWRKYRWIYSQLVNLVDSHIGDVLDAVDRNPELKKNTIIIFTSDHGEMQGAHERMAKNAPYEECQRIPFIVSGGNIPQGKRDNSLICNGVDLLPTICDLAGIQAPEGEGKSLKSRLTGKDKTPVREVLYTEGDGFLSVTDGRYKYTFLDQEKGDNEILIDLKDDEGEMKNIISRHRGIADKLKSYIPMDQLKPYRTAKKNKKSNNHKRTRHE